ncbi:MAG: HNH endonuclease [Patescibacteria group bacterium]|nr:HNH endonuclease [Patescibacteria group bacterium]
MLKPNADAYEDYKLRNIELRDGKYKRIPEHRAVVEESIGRPLADQERVHHINGKKRDNRIDNLFVCANNAAHHKARWSLLDILPELLERGIVWFDRTEGIYRICETSN